MKVSDLLNGLLADVAKGVKNRSMITRPPKYFWRQKLQEKHDSEYEPYLYVHRCFPQKKYSLQCPHAHRRLGKPFIQKIYGIDLPDDHNKPLSREMYYALNEALKPIYLRSCSPDLAPEVYYFYYKVVNGKRLVIKVYTEDLGEETMYSFMKRGNLGTGFRQWHLDRAPMISWYFGALQYLGFMHDDCWSRNVALRFLTQPDGSVIEKLCFFDFETSYVRDRGYEPMVRNAFKDFPGSIDLICDVIFHEDGIRSEVSTNSGFDLVYFIFTNAAFFSWDCTSEQWWSSVTRHILTHDAFKNSVHVDPNFLQWFTSDCPKGKMLRESLQVPRVCGQNIVV